MPNGGRRPRAGAPRSGAAPRRTTPAPAAQEARLQALQPDGWGGAWRANPSTGGLGYVMPAEADRFVISWRKQLDAVARALPWRSPPDAAAAHAAPMPRTVLLYRLNQHTRQCEVCSAALALADGSRMLLASGANVAISRAVTGG